MRKPKQPKAAAAAPKKEPEELSLRERLAAMHGNKDLKMPASMFSGGQGLTAAQHESKKLGPGHKRKAEETTIFKELNDEAYRGSDSEEEEKKQPFRDITRRK